MTIGALAAHCCPTESEFIFEGELLDRRRTLDCYNIKNNDAVVAIPVNRSDTVANHWMRVTRDSDSFMESIQFAIHHESHTNFLRLKDLRAQKLEFRPRAFRKMMVSRVQGCPPDQKRRLTTIVGCTPPEVPCTPLPVCW
jgi:hypothetical protein